MPRFPIHLKQVVDDFRNEKKNLLYQKYFLGQTVWYFQQYVELGLSDDPSTNYDQFKMILSSNLKVHFNNIAIVGSAKNGFSLSPQKDFRAFDPDKSDIDVIIVSSRYFQSLWEGYLKMHYKGIPLQEYPDVAKGIFKGFIFMSEPTLKNKKIISWVKRSDSMLQNIQIDLGILQPIKYRIYKSWNDVQNYHMYNIKCLKGRIYNVDSCNQKLSNILHQLQNNKK